MEPACTRTSHLTFFLGGSIKSTPSRSISRRSVFILSYHLRSGLPNDILPSCLPIKTISHLLHTCQMPRPSPASRSDCTNSIWWTVEIMKHFITVCNLNFPLRPKYLPQHPQPYALSSVWETKTTRRSAVVHVLVLYASGERMGRQRTMDSMVAGTDRSTQYIYIPTRYTMLQHWLFIDA